MINKVLISGGSGLVGTRLTELLLERGYEVAHLSRHKKPVSGVRVFEYDTQKNFIEEGALDYAQFFVHLAGAGVADKRWTAERKKLITKSRTETVDLVFKKLRDANIKPEAVISASGSNYYGSDTGDTKNSEDFPPGNDFLSKVCIDWEDAAMAINSTIRTVILRTGMVLSNRSGALPRISQPARFGFGAALGSGKQWVSWIHIDDLCRMYIEAIENESWTGAYNAVSALPVTNEHFTKEICQALKKPFWMPNVPAFALKLALGEMANIVLGSNYVVNQRILNETNFIYEFPDLKQALTNLLKS